MTTTDGPVFRSAIERIASGIRDRKGEQLSEDDISAELAATRATAEEIFSSITNAYTNFYGTTSIVTPTEAPRNQSAGPVGLIYGRIQSGKTRAMVTSAALALDNGFRIVVILTSDNNRLVRQTYTDFQTSTSSIAVIQKDDLKPTLLEAESTAKRTALSKNSNFGIILVCSKGSRSLQQVTEFLRRIDAGSYPALILDDEGDQATLDTNARKRSKGNASTQPSTIHSLVHSKESEALRSVLKNNVFVSVTGTPQAIVLQNAASPSHASFTYLLEAGSDYHGGETFFGSEDPNGNPYVQLIADDEKVVLLGETSNPPMGLQQAICRFVLNATALGQTQGWRPYKMLLHPSVKQSDHDKVAKMVSDYLMTISDAIADPADPSSQSVISIFSQEYSDLRKMAPSIPSLDALLAEARERLAARRIRIVNARTADESPLDGDGLNFVIGGNSVGRGLVFRDLLVTYYVRESKISNMDTIYQHNRMFGYRSGILPFMKIFLSASTYERFYVTRESDEQLREFLRSEDLVGGHGLVLTGVSVVPTRKNVLDANNVVALLPGHQLYPNRPVYQQPEASHIRQKVLKRLAEIFPDYLTQGSAGTIITSEEALSLLKPINTESTNAWSDKNIGAIVKHVAGKDNNVVLRFRTARSNVIQRNGLLISGVLSGAEVDAADQTCPTLWIVDVEAQQVTWSDKQFIYPTIILPNRSGPWVFNRS